MIPGAWIDNKSDKKDLIRIHLQIGISYTIVFLFSIVAFMYYVNNGAIYAAGIAVAIIVFDISMMASYMYGVKRCISRIKIEDGGITLSSAKSTIEIKWKEFGEGEKSRAESHYELLIWKTIKKERQRSIDEEIAESIRESYRRYFTKS